MEKYVPKSDIFPLTRQRDDHDLRLVRTAWYIQEECWQHNEYDYGAQKTSERLAYGPYETKDEAQKHSDILNQDKEKTRFGYKYRPIVKRLYEYTGQMWV